MTLTARRYENVPVRAEGFLAGDLPALPDDGRRYEVVEGVLMVGPPPSRRHQRACLELTFVLQAACPPGLVVLGPVPGVRAGERTCLAPDVCVLPTAGLLPAEPYAGVPPLVVDVRAAGDASAVDLLLKPYCYSRIGVPHYWVVDLDEPAVSVFARDDDPDGGYYPRLTVRRDAPLAVADPFPVVLRPSQLVPAGDPR
jgi:Uma2 family endonuclease